MSSSILPVSSTTSDYSALSTQTTETTQSNDLDKSAFLQLLVTSLQNQDPSSPMSTTELLAQTTQLSTMEQLTELTQLTQQAFVLQARSSATSLIGQTIDYIDSTGVTRSGVVAGVTLDGAVPTLQVGDDLVSLGSISSVRPSATSTSTSTTDAD